jgi:hypothetical protein
MVMVPALAIFRSPALVFVSIPVCCFKAFLHAINYTLILARLLNAKSKCLFFSPTTFANGEREKEDVQE